MQEINIKSRMVTTEFPPFSFNNNKFIDFIVFWKSEVSSFSQSSEKLNIRYNCDHSRKTTKPYFIMGSIFHNFQFKESTYSYIKFALPSKSKSLHQHESTHDNTLNATEYTLWRRWPWSVFTLDNFFEMTVEPTHQSQQTETGSSTSSE